MCLINCINTFKKKVNHREIEDAKVPGSVQILSGGECATEMKKQLPQFSRTPTPMVNSSTDTTEDMTESNERDTMQNSTHMERMIGQTCHKIIASELMHACVCVRANIACVVRVVHVRCACRASCVHKLTRR